MSFCELVKIIVHVVDGKLVFESKSRAFAPVGDTAASITIPVSAASGTTVTLVAKPPLLITEVRDAGGTEWEPGGGTFTSSVLEHDRDLELECTFLHATTGVPTPSCASGGGYIRVKDEGGGGGLFP